MATERVVEVPWAMLQIPQTGLILDVGSCDASYLHVILQSDRELHCMDPRDCRREIPPRAKFFCDSIIGNGLPRSHYDGIVLLSVLEHIGLPSYGLTPFPNGDRLAIAECWSLLRRGGTLVATVPAGQAKVVSWYRQYSPAMISDLFRGWDFTVSYWGYNGATYDPITEDQVEQCDYRDAPFHPMAGAGALAGIVARRP